MTKEELEKEIADWWRIKFCVELKDDICQRLIIDEVVELCNKIAEPREKRIEELKKENAELKERISKVAQNILNGWCKGDEPCPHLKKRDDQLTKAKKYIGFLLEVAHIKNTYNKEIEEEITKAEQFLNSEVGK